MPPGRLAAFWAITPHQVVERDGEAAYFVATIPLNLLTTTQGKIGSIAFQAGFDLISRFNAAFKAVVGCTPREYRAREEVA